MYVLKLCIFSFLVSWIEGRHSQLSKCEQKGDLFDCSDMLLTTVPENISKSIRHLDLSFNRIDTVKNNSLSFLYYLSFLKLNHNIIRKIERDAFDGLPRLLYLDLAYNNLNSIPDGVFDPLISLNDLSIHYNTFKGNQMKTLAKEISILRTLQTLSMDITLGFKFPHEFNKLTWLRTINIYGKVSFANYSKDTFSNLHMSPVTYLYLYTIISIEKETFLPLSRLKSLNIDINPFVKNNPVDEIFTSLFAFKGRNLSNIKLYGNRFNNAFTLERRHLKYVQDICLRQFTLDSMYISYVDPWAFQLFTVRSECLEYFEVSNNIIFDEQGIVLYGNIRNFKRLKVLKYNSYGDHVRSKRSNSFSSSSNATIVLPKTLQELYLDHSMTVRSSSNIIVVNGYNLHILSMPNNNIDDCNLYFLGIENLRFFDISGWTCKKLSEKLLSGFPYLEEFIARNSFMGIGFKSNPKISKFFRSNTKLQIIDLSNNSFSVIPYDLFNHPFEDLKQINLSHNKLAILPFFSPNINTTIIIDVSYNLLTSFTDKDLKMIAVIEPVMLYLRGNPFQCSCNTLNFLNWLNTKANVPDLVLVKCILQNGSQTLISEVLADLHSFEIKCKTKFWLIFSVILASVFLVCIVFTIVYFRYKFAIEYILLKWKMWWNGYKPLQKDYIYDAFVSYSHHDVSWVKEFHDNLSDMGFRLCLDAKDFIAGKPIADNVMYALGSSRKVIFIITRNFLSSHWGSFEMEMTRMHAFQEGRDEMVIIVLKDDITRDEMPTTLKSMWYKIICIQWPEEISDIPFHTKEIFYEKLKHALKRHTTGTDNKTSRIVCV